ncbi:helix-turn-helix transcriptional regulator [Actinocorallia sp. API 0066]|uniref:helix-turn-helix domain-containing protein n=1 Tax=Actinocorallia sp. API 0066 TaxID=2896846 RepID=UPI001E4DBE66|nr:helix-turn-helix transcriptional regulator [Actinocorallia sp. API 0066]MCD0450893.1 helix-turn-helix transcriptional regulator [Actinocorallia sp. API 0066]
MTPPASSSTAQAARQALADRLRDLRLDANLSARQLSAAAGWHEAKTSRIENAKKTPSEQDVRRWCDACGVPGLAPELIATVRAVDSTWLEWRRAERTGLKHLNVQVRDLYERTNLFRVYSPTFVPGPVQTEDAIRAILTSVRARRRVAVNDVEAAVAERVNRQESLFSRGGHRFHLVLEQAALGMQVGGPRVQAGQLRRLLDVRRLPAVSLGIIPSGTDRSERQWGVEMFFMFDDARVSVELVSGFLNVTAPAEIAMYAETFAGLSELAAYGDAAADLIEGALRDLSA